MRSARRFPASWPPALPIGSIASGCCCSSMSASRWARRCARWRRTIMCCWLGRIVSGLFGGVMGSIVLAIVTDLFALHLRGRVMGFVQTAFAASQVLGIPGRPVSLQPLELARLVRRAGRAVDRRDDRGHAADAAGERASRAEAGPQRVPASDRDGQPAALHAGFLRDDPARDRRIHADAVRQRLHRQQSRHRHRASADDLSGLRIVQHLHRTLGRPRQRCLRQISDLCIRHRGVDHHGA